jgi:hypothetical protein
LSRGTNTAKIYVESWVARLRYDELFPITAGAIPREAEAKMNPDMIRRLFPRASEDTIKANETNSDTQLQGSLAERDQAPALGDAVQGETKSVQRVTVRFTGYRVRPLDPDNFAGGCKDLLDGLCHAGLLPSDSPQHITLVTEQEKVDHRTEERTCITLEYPSQKPTFQKKQ